ncbi:hypothetical protein [Deinococcus knuensis]|uniref:ABC transporter permease n=1 Tax=Deinococcus knuensis TaxID=1837380 RepID=A0ABQ2SA43_9DEIO|nr:hypothetical protein [Deinococcus knuensis]GGS13619.1 hypothetical protein GCM10008961_00970 [Deinococcus knuensis]
MNTRVNSGPERAVWAAQRLTARRRRGHDWRAWRAAGLPLIVAYLGGAGLIALLSVWQSYRPAPFDLPLPLLVPLLVATLLLAILGARRGRPPLNLRGTDLIWLRSPAAPWATLLWPLLRTTAPWTVGGVLLGAGLLAWNPAGWAVAVSLPLLGGSVPVVRAAAHAAAHAGQPASALLAGTLLPLLGLLHPALFPVGVALTGALAGWTWRRALAADLPPRLLRQLDLQALRTGARRLGLPAPVMTADGRRAPRTWSPPLRRATPARALLWRASLILLDRPHRLLPAVLGGAALASGLPTLAALPLAVTLTLRPPALPVGAPVSARRARLLTFMPAGLSLGALSLLGALLAGAAPAAALTALLSPWAAHAVHAWLGDTLPGTGAAGQVSFGAALAPGLLAALCGGFGVGAAAPAAVLILGLLATLATPLA